MNKRQFLACVAAAALARPGMARNAMASAQGTNMIKASGVTFEWHHRNNRLFAGLSAPTSGWVAVGFNNRSGLADTRFVIADVSAQPIRVEEHLALVPNHPEIGQLGLAPALDDAAGQFSDGLSRLSFTLAHFIPGPPELHLLPGRAIHLMLAWSQAGDFDHHSTWRQHFEITL